MTFKNRSLVKNNHAKASWNETEFHRVEDACHQMTTPEREMVLGPYVSECALIIAEQAECFPEINNLGELRETVNTIIARHIIRTANKAAGERDVNTRKTG